MSVDLSKYAPAFLGFRGGSTVKTPTCNAGAAGSILGSGRPPGGGHGNPLQGSCLKNPMDRGPVGLVRGLAPSLINKIHLLSEFGWSVDFSAWES